MGYMTAKEYQAFIKKSNSSQTIKKTTSSKTSKTRSKPRNIEHQIQAQFVKWFHLTYPQLEPFFWAIPNGGFRFKKTARDMKEEGEKKGVPDLQLAYPSKGYHGLFIEMKRSEVGKRGGLINKGDPSEAQIRRMEALEGVGYHCVVCYSFDEACEVVKDYLNYVPCTFKEKDYLDGLM